MRAAKHPAGAPPRQSDRAFIEAVVHVVRSGCPWRDLPAEHGRWRAVYVRFRRWETRGVWLRLWQAARGHVSLESLLIDSTMVRAHQHAAGAPKKTAAIRLWDVREQA